MIWPNNKFKDGDGEILEILEVQSSERIEMALWPRPMWYWKEYMISTESKRKRNHAHQVSSISIAKEQVFVWIERSTNCKDVTAVWNIVKFCAI